MKTALHKRQAEAGRKGQAMRIQEEARKAMEIKEEFYQIMTLTSAYIYHEALGLNFVIEDSQVVRVEKEPQAAGTAQGQ